MGLRAQKLGRGFRGAVNQPQNAHFELYRPFIKSKAGYCHVGLAAFAKLRVKDGKTIHLFRILSFSSSSLMSSAPILN